MKKLITVLATLLITIAFCIPVVANSAPVWTAGQPDYEILPLEDCPITVKNETLLFDFQQEETFTSNAKVTATYQMENPMNLPLEVKMAFPMISSFQTLGESVLPVISANGIPVPYEIQVGKNIDTLNRDEDYNAQRFSDAVELEQILSSITSQYKPTSFLLEDTVTVYRVKAAGDNFCLGIKMKLDPQKTKILSFGGNGFHQDPQEGTVSLASWDLDRLTYAIIGEEPLNTEIKAYTNAGLEQEYTENTEIQVTKEEMSLQNYLSEGRIVFGKTLPAEISQAQYLSCLIETMDTLYQSGNMVVSGDDLFGYDTQQKIFVLTYTATFPPEALTELSVTYTMTGSVDQTKTSTPLYHYGYITNPAKHWAAFHSLQVTILPPAKAPYMVESSIPFERDSRGGYTASLSKLPDQDITFSLYDKESVEKSLFSSLRFPEITEIVSFILIVIILAAFFRGKKRVP